MKAEELAKTLDFTLLSPDVTRETVIEACERAREHHFVAVCSHPEMVPDMVEALNGCDVKTCAAVGFPRGDQPTAEKARVAERAIANGVDEIDVVMNVGAMLEGRIFDVRDDLRAVVRAVRARSANDGRGNVIVKAIIEAPALGDKLIRLACRIVDDVGADYAKTCTGVGTIATVHHVELMRDALSENVGVKASGGITTLEGAEELVNAGATRLGSSAAIEIIEAALAREAS